MKQIIRTAARHPRVVLALLALATILFASQLPNVQVQISAEAMLKKQSPAWQHFLVAEQTFGSEDIVIVVARDPQLFDNDSLTAVRHLMETLEALPFVTHTMSLFDVPYLRNVDGFVHTRPYLDELPMTPEAAARVKADAIRNPLVRDNLISNDGRTLAINVFLDRDSDDTSFDRMATAAIEQAIGTSRAQLEEVFQVGMSTIRSDMTERIRSDQRIFLPLAVLVLLLTLAFTLRRVTAALLPFCTAGLSVIWTLGFLGVMGIPINIMTSIVPALVVVIGSTEDIHLLAEYAAGIRAGQGRPAAIDRMADNMGLAVLLTFVTTYVGFLSIALNDIELLQQFGLVASTGLLFNFIITVLLVPVILSRFGHRRLAKPHARAGLSPFQRLAIGLMLRLRRHRNLVFAAAAVLTIGALLAATQLRIDNSFLDYLDEDAPLRVNAQRLHSELSGMHAFSIVVDADIENTFLQVNYLEQLRTIQRLVDDAQVFDRSFSFADFVVLLNSVMESDDDMVLDLPESDDVVREYMLFIKAESVANYVSSDFSMARILVRHNITSSDRLNRAVTILQERIASSVDPALQVEITGKSLLSDQAVEDMAYGQLKSLLLISIVIVCLVSLLFVSLRAGIIALLPNLLPVAMLFGLMALFGIPLNAGTSMIAAIALGICVDATMHVMSRFHEELKVHISRRAALCSVLKAEADPIFATSIALAAGFLVFATSSFQPVVHVGVLSAVVILVAVLATFVLTPLLLGTSRLLTVWDILSYRIQDRALRNSPLFAGMYVWQIKKLLLASDIRRFAAGDRIIAQGATGGEMFLLLDGVVEARKRQPDGSVEPRRRIDVGELFGEVAPLSGGVRTADVVAIEDCKALVLSWRRIERLTHLHPVLAFRLFRNLTRIIGKRLTQTREYTTGEPESPPDSADARR